VRIAISAEFIRPGRVGGAEQAVHALVRGIDAARRPTDTIRVIGSEGIVGGLRTESPRRFARSRFVQETASLRHVGREADVCYFPNYFTPPVPAGCRVVTTIFDSQFRHFPDNFSLQKRAWLRVAHRVTLKRASMVTTGSEWARQELLEANGDKFADRVVAIPLPVDWAALDGIRAQRSRPYVLAVASHYAHKNLETLVRSFRLVRQAVGDVELVLVGQLSDQLIGIRRASSVREVIAAECLEAHVTVTGHLPAADLGALYRGAELFVFPSTYEGFGLPPVEALGFGLPVITTRCASLPEVTLGLAEYVNDPYDVEELAHLMVAQLESPRPPSPQEVEAVRATYEPSTIGGSMIELFDSVVA
jgi:glycosyltransferase involved in cell wall biosynthesis